MKLKIVALIGVIGFGGEFDPRRTIFVHTPIVARLRSLLGIGTDIERIVLGFGIGKNSARTIAGFVIFLAQ